MKITLTAALTALALAFLSDLSMAQSNKKNGTAASVAGTTCTTGQTCSANCDSVGWCSRMVCSGNKWEKRLVSCIGSLCPPKC